MTAGIALLRDLVGDRVYQDRGRAIDARTGADVTDDVRRMDKAGWVYLSSLARDQDGHWLYQPTWTGIQQLAGR